MNKLLRTLDNGSCLFLLTAFLLITVPVSAQALDSDGDLVSDDDEIDCGSDPFDSTSRCEGLCGLPRIDIWDSNDLPALTLIGQIETIKTAQTGRQHYNYFSDSGHPSGVSFGASNSNLWVHESTTSGDLTFGFIFGADNSGPPTRTSTLNFRLVDSDTDPFISQSDEPNEAVESPPGSDAFLGSFTYLNNTDGIAVSGISGDAWTIIVSSVDFGSFITSWFAANGASSGFGDDLPLAIGREYRLTPACHPPAGAPVVILDRDHDGIIDEEDNCLETPNPGQEDFDGDGLGDACDGDDDGDEVADGADVCAQTLIPEVAVPSLRLGTNRFALIDDDTTFDTTDPEGNGPRRSFTTADTAGCSCEQIIRELGLGEGHSKFGCSISAMEDWVARVNQ